MHRSPDVYRKLRPLPTTLGLLISGETASAKHLILSARAPRCSTPLCCRPVAWPSAWKNYGIRSSDIPFQHCLHSIHINSKDSCGPEADCSIHVRFWTREQSHSLPLKASLPVTAALFTSMSPACEEVYVIVREMSRWVLLVSGLRSGEPLRPRHELSLAILQ